MCLFNDQWVFLTPKLFLIFVFFFCYFFSEQLTQLISNLNEQKRKLKKSGIVVDGKKYHVKFTGTV